MLHMPHELDSRTPDSQRRRDHLPSATVVQHAEEQGNSKQCSRRAYSNLWRGSRREWRSRRDKSIQKSSSVSAQAPISSGYISYGPGDKGRLEGTSSGRDSGGRKATWEWRSLLHLGLI